MDKRYRIVASLEYGKVYSIIIQSICLIGIIAGIFCIPGIIILFIREYQPGLFLLIFFFGLCLPSLVYGYLSIRTVRKKVSLALKDAVELRGEAVITDANGHSLGVKYSEDCYLTIKFLYKGEKFIRRSAKPSLKRPFIKFDKLFRKYERKTVQILYSESQDHVLIIED